MATRRFYVDIDFLNQPELIVTGELFHHIHEVCRFSVGDQFELLAGDGFAHRVQISQKGSRDLRLVRLDSRALAIPQKPLITLALSVPKLPKVDWIVEKAVELGVSEIRPFVSDYSFLRKVSELSSNRLQRWQKIIQAATQQTGRGDLMRFSPPVSLDNLLNEFNQKEGVGGLFPYEGQAELDLPEALGDLKRRSLDHLWVFVGSEGGFSQSEVEAFARVGLKPVSMGDQILRVETACLALVSIIKYELEQARSA